MVKRLHNISAEEVRALPDEKLEELARSAVGTIQHCPECDEETVFIAPAGHNSRSECHNCDYERRTSG